MIFTLFPLQTTPKSKLSASQQLALFSEVLEQLGPQPEPVGFRKKSQIIHPPPASINKPKQIQANKVEVFCSVSQPELKQVHVASNLIPEREAITSYRREVFVNQPFEAKSKFQMRPKSSTGPYIAKHRYDILKSRIMSQERPVRYRHGRGNQTDSINLAGSMTSQTIQGLQFSTQNERKGKTPTSPKVQLVGKDQEPNIVDQLIQRTKSAPYTTKQILTVEKPPFCSTVRHQSFRRQKLVPVQSHNINVDVKRIDNNSRNHSGESLTNRNKKQPNNTLQTSPAIGSTQLPQSFGKLQQIATLYAGIERPDEVIREAKDQANQYRMRQSHNSSTLQANVQLVGKNLSQNSIQSFNSPIFAASAQSVAVRLRGRVLSIAERETNVLLAKLYQSDLKLQLSGVLEFKEFACILLCNEQKMHQDIYHQYQEKIGLGSATINVIQQIFDMCAQRQCQQILSLQLDQPQIHQIIFVREISKIVHETLQLQKKGQMYFRRLGFENLYHLLLLLFTRYNIDYKVSNESIDLQTQKFKTNGHFLLAVSIISIINQRTNNQLMQYMLGYAFSNFISNQTQYFANYFISKQSRFSHFEQMLLPGEEITGDLNKKITLYDYIIENKFNYQFNKGDYCIENEFLGYDYNKSEQWLQTLQSMFSQCFYQEGQSQQKQQHEMKHTDQEVIITRYNEVKQISPDVINALSIYLYKFGPFMYSSYDLADVDENIKQYEQIQMLLFFAIQEIKSYIFKHALDNMISTVFQGVDMANPFYVLQLYCLIIQLYYVVLQKEANINYFLKQHIDIRQYKKITHYRFVLNMSNELAIINQLLLNSTPTSGQIELIENNVDQTHFNISTDPEGNDYRDNLRDCGIQRLPAVYQYWFLEKQPQQLQKIHLHGLIRQFQARFLISIKNGEIWSGVKTYLISPQEHTQLMEFIHLQGWQSIAEQLVDNDQT